MSENPYNPDSPAQNVRNYKASQVVALMNNPTSIIKQTTTNCSSPSITHSIKNSDNENRKIYATHKSLINSALVKRKQYPKRRHLLMVPWIISAFVGIISDIIYLIVSSFAAKQHHMLLESISYVIGIVLQIFVLHRIYVLYKDIQRKFVIRQQHKIIWRNNEQQLMGES